ncbi:arylsulfatase A-like isoform X1 [Ptychodera flava]|uniref:arylsulfatase A-like isoform X1 n=1 Tax=Ptychodera flava TaxID=63121 RepID=UPI00396AAD3B
MAALFEHGLFAHVVVLITLFLFSPGFCVSPSSTRPNILIVFADDLGYGDLSCYGHPTSESPNIDKLAAEGLLFTQFYSANSVCSPSRAALLTARLPPRTGVWPDVLRPSSTGGLPHSETTIAALLKPLGYTTGMVGKWHLGVGKNQTYLPSNHGFDSYYGIPYSTDMCPCLKCFYPADPCWDTCDTRFTSCPIFQNSTIVEQPADYTTIAQKYSMEGRNFIARNAKSGKPFFLYYATQHTHFPNFAGKQFRNSTRRGAFGDSLAELDWEVGQLLEELKLQNLEKNTFVFFTSDNGPSLFYQVRGGMAGLLKCGKGTTYEGGQRVPAIAYWPGKIQPGRTRELASTLDLLPTIVNLVNGTLPEVTLDGYDIRSILFQRSKSPREVFYYFYSQMSPKYGVYAIRYKQFKAHFYTQGYILSGLFNHDGDCRPTAARTEQNPPLLFNLDEDPSEAYNLGNDPEYTDVLNEIGEIKQQFEAGLVWRESEINKPKDPSVEPCCNPGCHPFPTCCSCTKFGT